MYLVDFYLFVEEIHFQKFEEHRHKVEAKLRRNGFLEKKTVSFFSSKNLSQIFNSSIGKLQGIQDIVNFEFSVLKDDLKMVILTDFIKKEFLVSSSQNNSELNKIGVVSIFEKLRRENADQKKIGVLTGSMVIIPKSTEHTFQQFCHKKEIHSISTSELSYDENYLVIHITDQIRHDIVHIITEIFQSGAIQVLIGTKSLLGEGWDAPKMNSLILASFVSSFVLSNQMRGRVIRKDRDQPNKTGNIWHLVCYDEKSPNGGHDFLAVKRRFKTFVGVSNNDIPSIENNFDRLNIPIDQEKKEISIINLQTFAFAKDRENLFNRWKVALDKGNILIEEIKVPVTQMRNNAELKMSYLKNMIADFSAIVLSTVLAFLYEIASEVIQSLDDIHSIKDFFKVTLFAGIVGIFTYGRKFFIATKQYIKYKNVAKNLDLMGNIVLKSLINERLIHTPESNLKIVTSDDIYKNSICHLEGATNYEKSIFINSLQELMMPVDNPRYVLEQSYKSLFSKKNIYFPVPEVFAKNKKSADFFCILWSKTIEKSTLVFTRTIEGRNILLQLRFENLLKRNHQIEHIHKWTR